MKRTDFEKYIKEAYGALPEYPWESQPSYAVFRHKDNKKWFAVTMCISKRKLGINSDEPVDVVNLKCDPIVIGSLRGEQGFYPAYHMSKTHWITAVLDGETDAEKLKWLLSLSFELTAKKRKSNKA